MFQPDEVVQVELTLSPEAASSLDTDPRTYVPAGFAMTGSDGRSFGPWDIELKLKGSASMRPLTGKAAFKLKFPKGSRPDGLKKLTLNNMVQDPSKVHEVTAYEVFRAAGIAAPRTGYATVSVNGEPYGLYLNVETLDDVSLPLWYPSTQHLYEGTLHSHLRPGGETTFEIDEGSESDASDLATLIDAF